MGGGFGQAGGSYKLALAGKDVRIGDLDGVIRVNRSVIDASSDALYGSIA